MIFGKHINRYYLRYAFWLIIGLVALVGVDYLQLEIPALYGMVVNGLNNGFVEIDGVERAFDMELLLDTIENGAPAKHEAVPFSLLYRDSTGKAKD